MIGTTNWRREKWGGGCLSSCRALPISREFLLEPALNTFKHARANGRNGWYGTSRRATVALQHFHYHWKDERKWYFAKNFPLFGGFWKLIHFRRKLVKRFSITQLLKRLTIPEIFSQFFRKTEKYARD